MDIRTLETIQKNANALNLVYKSQIVQALEPYEKMQTMISQSLAPAIAQYQQIAEVLHNMTLPYKELCAKIENWNSVIAESINNISLPVLNLYYEEVSEEEEPEINDTNERIITEILQPDPEKKIDVVESPIITLSPINDRVLKYLSENPDAFYLLSDDDFEIVMAEIYSKLGYNVTRTQATRDGGKDLIIRKAETLGDFIYYVECKRNAPQRHIGVGIVRNLVGTINTDRVNGGILATTSFFTKDARKFILDNKWNCQIQMHDYIKIQNLLNMTI